MVWAVIRASIQSITLDEADTYFWFASKSIRDVFYPFPNNHILNTLLIWITTHAFGTSIITVRTPALIGAALYVSTCYFLCRSITSRFSLQFSILICLVYNPFILDFMAAARGYSLANAFLLAAIAIPVWHHLKGRPSLDTSCALASLALGLSFAANFSFVFADLSAFLAMMIWALRRREKESLVRVVSFSVLPGLLVALLLCGYPLAHWPKGEMWYSAASLKEMTHSLIEVSLYQPNPRFLDVELYDTMEFIRPMLLPLLGILCVCQLVATAFDGTWKQDRDTRWLGRFAAAVGGITASAVLLHWLAFHFHKLPLPMTRTGVFLLPLCTLFAGVIGAAPARSLVAQWLRRGITVVLISLACYFVFCLRFTYFKEYQEGADVKDVYSMLARLNHKYGVNDVVASGLYANSLNFYRVLSKKETFPEFQYLPQHQFPAGKSIYVVHGPWEQEFIRKERLVIIYRGKSTEIVVAVRPDGAIPPVSIDPE